MCVHMCCVFLCEFVCEINLNRHFSISANGSDNELKLLVQLCTLCANSARECKNSLKSLELD